MRDLAVVLLSGGLDSTVTAVTAAQDYDLALLHLQYGQRTEARERRAFDEIAAHFCVSPERCQVAKSTFLAEIGGSALTDPAIDIPPADLESNGVPITYVPFRNAHLLCQAVSWAEVIDARAVFIGVVEEDGLGYPDCTEAFCRAFASAVAAGTMAGTKLTIETPLIQLAKAAIIKRGVELDAPLHLTWSCYEREDVACGRCDSCTLRLRAFELAGIPDPISYDC